MAVSFSGSGLGWPWPGSHNKPIDLGWGAAAKVRCSDIGNFSWKRIKTRNYGDILTTTEFPGKNPRSEYWNCPDFPIILLCSRTTGTGKTCKTRPVKTGIIQNKEKAYRCSHYVLLHSTDWAQLSIYGINWNKKFISVEMSRPGSTDRTAGGVCENWSSNLGSFSKVPSSFNWKVSLHFL